MRIVIPGGAGHLGRIASRALVERGHWVVVLTRDVAALQDANRDTNEAMLRFVEWDGRTLGPWASEVDGADVVLNLAGRSVDCRYTVDNLRQMMDSRVFSTRAVGAAIAAASRPPATWLQMSTATIYAHRFDSDNDELHGVLGGEEPDAPAYWRYSIDIARAWERELAEAPTPDTRKVALRSAMVMGSEPGGAFEPLLRVTRLGLGGRIASGRQYMSWIHEVDFVRALVFLIDRDDIAGSVNLASPSPIPQREFMAMLRRACGQRVGLPATRWMLELGALVLRTDSELLLKSRRVVPGVLQRAGFDFAFPTWDEAAVDLVTRWSTGSETRAAA